MTDKAKMIKLAEQLLAELNNVDKQWQAGFLAEAFTIVRNKGDDNG